MPRNIIMFYVKCSLFVSRNRQKLTDFNEKDGKIITYYNISEINNRYVNI